MIHRILDWTWLTLRGIGRERKSILLVLIEIGTMRIQGFMYTHSGCRYVYGMDTVTPYSSRKQNNLNPHYTQVKVPTTLVFLCKDSMKTSASNKQSSCAQIHPFHSNAMATRIPASAVPTIATSFPMRLPSLCALGSVVVCSGLGTKVSITVV